MCKIFFTRFLITLCIFIFLPLFGYSNNKELKIQHWNTNSGVPKKSIISINQDSIGYILFHCVDGVFRFSGNNSKRINHLSDKNKINKQVYLNGNRLYVGGKVQDGVYHEILKTNSDYWVTTDLGLGKVDTINQKVRFMNLPADLPSRKCLYLSEAPDGKIWFTISLGGLAFYDPLLDKFFTSQNIHEYDSYLYAYDIFSQLVDRYFSDLYFDKNGNLWIATLNNDVYKITFHPQKFQYFRFEYEQEGSLTHRDISYPLAMKNGDVWIGTWGGGINEWQQDELKLATPNFQQLPLRLNNGETLREKRIFPIMEDSHKDIWFGTFGGGLYFLDGNRKAKNDYRCRVFNTTNSKIPSNLIRSLCEGINEDIWCGTQNGLVHIDANFKMRSSMEELENPDMFNEQSITMIGLTGNHNLWIGTKKGNTYLWDLTSNKVKHFQYAGGKPMGSLTNVQEIDGVDWFASGKGIFYYNHRLNKFLAFKNNHLLPSRHLESVLSDKNGQLWFGSAQGLIKINPTTAEVSSFQMYGGHMGNSYTQGASTDSLGYMYFGSRYGFYRFHPDQIESKETVCPIVINEVGISGKNYTIDSLYDSSMWQNIDSVSGLKLKYDQNNISIDYTSLNYNRDEVARYQVMLEGNDINWIETNDTRRSWSALSPGFYTFKLKENNKDNLCVLHFAIRPPWWNTVYAYAAYIVVFLLLFIVLFSFVSTRSTSKEKMRQKEKFDQLRFRFFLNVSHEIRTPLTLIKGAIDRLMESDRKEDKELNRIHYNADRLMRMVNEVLDLKKMEAPEMTANKSFFNLKEFIESTVDAFHLREEKCKINLFLPSTPVWIYSSRDLIETILYNLLSNAIKFSNDKGIVEVHLVIEDQTCRMKVRDYGIGISTEEQDLIFNRYFKTENKNSSGAGIGLSLVQELIRLLDGKIRVESEFAKGSTFTIDLPVEHLADVQGEKEFTLANNKETLLIVDDMPDIRSFVKEIFEENYQCIEASNGVEALEIIKNNLPSLILSDVMMPEMNGFELCKRVKENIETSHIPVVLLTAKTGYQAELNATECSADAYITKPFKEQLLKLKVEKLIEQRQLLWNKYRGQDQEVELKSSFLNPIDQKFMDKLEAELEKELDNSALNIDLLATNIALSSSGLYRKTKALTGLSPVEYIRSFRLNKAAELLKSSAYSVSEISDMTGFGTSKYFSRCFKEHFKKAPLNFRKSNLN